MSETTQDPEKFKRRWYKEADDLWALGNTLPQEHWDELEDHIKDVKELIDVATEELEENDE